MLQRKILITGAAGFIGSSLLEKLLKDQGCYIVAVDNFLTGKQKNLPPQNNEQWKFITSDVNNYNDLSEIMATYLFDYVFHYAAVVGVKRTLAYPLKVLEDIEGFKNILSLSQKTGVKRIFFTSSSEVYGEPVEIPQTVEKTPLNARLPYAVVKNIGEVYIKSFQKVYGLPYTIFRIFNTYGPKQSDDFVITKFIKQAKKGKDITVYGDGTQTRTFCYIDDNIETAIKILNGNIAVNETLNVGNETMVTINDLASMIIKITGSKSKIRHLPPLKEGDMTRRQPDNKRMKEILGRELISPEDGLKKLVQDSI